MTMSTAVKHVTTIRHEGGRDLMPGGVSSPSSVQVVGAAPSSLRE